MSVYPGYKERHRRLLDCESPQQVALLLSRAGVRGRRKATNACPIAVYLSVGVDVDSYLLQSFVLPRGKLSPVVTLHHTRPMAQFIELFDQGCYPELQL